MGVAVRINAQARVTGRLKRRLRRDLVRMTRDLLPCADMELSVLIIDDHQMRLLNREYRGIDRETDVLSFPQLTSDELDRIEYCEGELLGDIALNVDAAERQAVEGGHSLARELELLAAHGLLHLVGYEHDDENGARRMSSAEKSLAGGGIIGIETGDTL